MIAPLAYGVMALALLLAAWTGFSASRYRPTGEIQMIIVIILELALLVQAIIAIVLLSGAHLDEPVTFVAYSIGALVPLPVAFQLARLERTRWGSLIVCFAAIVAAVMTLRIAALWRLFA